MPGKIQQSLGFLTAYLKDENTRLDQEIKEKQLNTLLIKAGDKFQDVSSTEDAKDMYYQMMSVAGSLEVGKEATPFLNQMLSTSVAFIKEDEAKTYEKNYISELNKRGYSFNGLKGDDATRIVSTDLASIKMETGFYNEEGQAFNKVFKINPATGKWDENQTISLDPRTDKMRLAQQKELIRTKEAYSSSNRPDIRPSTYTFTTEINGKMETVPVNWTDQDGGKYYYKDPTTGKNVEATVGNGTFDQKTPMSTKISGDRNVIESELATQKSTYEGYGRSLAIALKGKGIIKDSQLFNGQKGEYVGGNEALLYESQDAIRNSIKNNSSMTPEEKTSINNLLTRFTNEHDSYIQSKRELEELDSSTSKGPKDAQTDDATIMNEINNIIKDPKNPGYNTLAKIIDSIYPNYQLSPYGKWTNTTYGMSPEKKQKVFDLYKSKRRVKN